MEILDVDLLAFETGSAEGRRSVVDGVLRSLATGFVYVEHDLSIDLIDEAYAQLEAFFTLPQERKDTYVVPGSNGQSGYTGLLVETAAIADVPDWKEMLNWGHRSAMATRCERVSPPLRSADPSRARPAGCRDLLMHFHHSVADLQRRVLRIIAEGLRPTRPSSTRCSPTAPPSPGQSITRRWSRRPANSTSGPANTPTSTSSRRCPAPRRPVCSLQNPRRRVVRRRPAGGLCDHQHRSDARAIEQRHDPPGIHRVVSGEVSRAIAFSRAIRPPDALDDPGADAEHRHRGESAAVQRDRCERRADKVLYEINLVEDGRRVDADD